MRRRRSGLNMLGFPWRNAGLAWLFLAALTLACGAIGGATPTAAPPPTATTGPPTRTPAPAASPASFNPAIEIVGEPEVVYLWETDRCADNQFPDLPARAIRTTDGQVQIYTSSTTSYRLVGPDFDSLAPDCTPVFVSDFDRDPAHYNYGEWVGAPYTEDGQTVYAIIHDEFHGDQAGSLWQADGDFRPEQGYNGWRYLGRIGASAPEMRFDSANNRWQGNRPLCQIFQQGMHPDLGCEPVRAWTSPVTDTVRVTGRVYDLDPGGGNGVSAKIALRGEELWSATIANGDADGQVYDLEAPVQAGDVIEFSLNALGDANWDSTYFNPGINLGPPPCPSGRHDMCTLISLTYAISSDGGKSFAQPPAPGHLLANLPYRYDPEWMRAIWQPSGIVQHPGDGYYYALIQRDEHSADYSFNVQGMCLIRTRTLDDPASWRAWDGAGFAMQFVNPYLEPEVDPEAHTCELVTPEIGALTYGLSYNTFFERFVAVGVGFDGFYFSTSTDLIQWTPRQFFMAASQTFAPGAEPPFLPYPTLIDPESPSASFDVTGQTPYLYFSRFNGSATALNVDLLRVPVKLQK